MVHVLGLSGGHTSGYAAYLLNETLAKQGDEVVFLFADVGQEHEGTYEFIRNIHQHWGIKIHCIRAVTHELGVGNTYEEISIDEIGYRPETFEAHFAKYGSCTIKKKHCTDRMKGIIMDKRKKDRFGKDFITWIGFRADEGRRIKEVEQQLELMLGDKKKAKRVATNVRYLAHISDATKSDVDEWWESQPFKLQIEPYEGNCIFCIEKSPEKLVLAARRNPERTEDYIRLVNSPSVRVMDELHPSIQYRGYLSLEAILEAYKDVPTEVIEQNLKRSKRISIGCGSGECIPTPQLDLFGEM